MKENGNLLLIKKSLKVGEWAGPGEIDDEEEEESSCLDPTPLLQAPPPGLERESGLERLRFKTSDKRR